MCDGPQNEPQINYNVELFSSFQTIEKNGFLADE